MPGPSFAQVSNLLYNRCMPATDKVKEFFKENVWRLVLLVIISALLWLQIWKFGETHEAIHLFARELNIAAIISILLAMFIDGQLRKREQDKLIDIVNSSSTKVTARVIEAIRESNTNMAKNLNSELSELSDASAQRFSDLTDKLEKNAQALQHIVIESLLSNKFGEEIFQEIRTCLTNIPFIRDEFEIEFEITNPPEGHSAQEFVQLNVEIKSKIRCVSLEDADFREFLPRFFSSASQSTDQHKFHYCTVDKKKISLVGEKVVGAVEMHSPSDQIIFRPYEQKSVTFKYSLIRRKNDHETFYTYLPAKKTQVKVKRHRDNVRIGLDPTHRKGVKLQRDDLDSTTSVWNFDVPLIPFQGFEIGWSEEPVVLGK